MGNIVRSLLNYPIARDPCRVNVLANIHAGAFDDDKHSSRDNLTAMRTYPMNYAEK